MDMINDLQDERKVKIEPIPDEVVAVPRKKRTKTMTELASLTLAKAREKRSQNAAVRRDYVNARTTSREEAVKQFRTLFNRAYDAGDVSAFAGFLDGLSGEKHDYKLMAVPENSEADVVETPAGNQAPGDTTPAPTVKHKQLLEDIPIEESYSGMSPSQAIGPASGPVPGRVPVVSERDELIDQMRVQIEQLNRKVSEFNSKGTPMRYEPQGIVFI